MQIWFLRRPAPLSLIDRLAELVKLCGPQHSRYISLKNSNGTQMEANRSPMASISFLWRTLPKRRPKMSQKGFKTEHQSDASTHQETI